MNRLREEWEALTSKKDRERLEEAMIKRHGRIISGYCPCCGTVIEINGTCYHDEECAWHDRPDSDHELQDE